MMFGEGVLTFREFAMGETLPLATIHGAVLEFLRGREDAVLFGAQAVNAYTDEPRMTQDVDILSPRAGDLAEELRKYLGDRFKVTVRVRVVADGSEFRVYQVRKPSNRHLADVRLSDPLPSTQRIGGVLVLSPVELVASKVMAYHSRRGTPKSFTDRRDIAVLLLAFPDLRSDARLVRACLVAHDGDEDVLQAWEASVGEPIIREDDEGSAVGSANPACGQRLAC